VVPTGGLLVIERLAVKRLVILVAPSGQWVFENSSEFRAALGDPDPDYDASAFAVKNLGFIKFQMFDQSVIEIELHPATVELPALLAVQQQINASTVPLFRIRYLTTSWQSEIHSSREAAITRLSELCAARFHPSRQQERFLVEPQDYMKLFDDEDNPLRLMAQKWRMSLAFFDPTVISFAIKHQLLSRMMIFGVKPNHSDPVFRFIGDGFQWLQKDYQFYGVGERVENQPDKDYGGWVSEFYKNVATTGQPRYDWVTAAIQVTPGKVVPDDRKLFMTCYERLLLPWKTSSDEVLVSMLSRRRADAESEPDDSVAKNPVLKIAAKSS
jgi:hypothetical protein